MAIPYRKAKKQFFGGKMLNNSLRWGFNVAILSVLVACKSTTVGVSQFSSFANYPVNGTVSIDGQAATGQYTANLGSGVVAVGAISGPNSATALDTVKNGQSVALQIQAPGSNVSWNTNNGDTATVSGGVVGYVSADGSKVGFQTSQSALGYQYQTHGIWITGYNTGAGTMGVGTFGNRTKTGSVPGSATYNGTSLGILADSAGQPFVTVSAVNITTNFSTATVTSTGTTKVNLNTANSSSAANLDFSGSGLVSGNKFSASISGTGISGSAAGLFYGPNGTETGGTFVGSGTGGTYAGSFGAN